MQNQVFRRKTELRLQIEDLYDFATQSVEKPRYDPLLTNLRFALLTNLRFDRLWRRKVSFPEGDRSEVRKRLCITYKSTICKGEAKQIYDLYLLAKLSKKICKEGIKSNICKYRKVILGFRGDFVEIVDLLVVAFARAPF